MDTIPTPRTDKAAYYMGRTGPDRDNARWCDLLNESRAIERDLVDACNLLRQVLPEWADEVKPSGRACCEISQRDVVMIRDFLANR